MPTVSPIQSSHPAATAEFDFLIGFSKPLVRPDEAARVLGRSLNYVYGLIEAGELEAHKPLDREHSRYVITRRSVAMHLLRSATYRSADFAAKLLKLIDEVSGPESLDKIIAHARTRKERIS